MKAKAKVRDQQNMNKKQSKDKNTRKSNKKHYDLIIWTHFT